MAVALTIFLVVLFIGLGAGFGVAWLVILPVALVLLVGGWLAALGAARRSPREAIQQTRRPRLLGPGGADDPDRGRR